MEQGGSEADRTITSPSRIRKAVIAHDGLSMNAKNTKIITVDGVVTLRGPVKTEEEAAIATAAHKTAGMKRPPALSRATTNCATRGNSIRQRAR
jgi:hyperosmotically inducible protein